MQTCAPEERHALPGGAAVFILRTGGGEPYISRTKHLRARVARLLDPAALASKRVSLAGRVSAIEYLGVHSDFEARWMQYQVLRAEFPDAYRRKLRLRGAPLIRLGMKNQFPRAALTRRAGDLRGGDLRVHTRYYGPFAARAQAQAALHAALDLFQVRRCIEDLAPHPEHPGCIYGEMKMCLAPCQAKIGAEEYRREAARLQSYLASNGASSLDEIAAERERLASALDFEAAAALHTRWQKMKDAARLIPEFVRPLDRWDAALLLPGAREASLKLFRVRQAVLAGPVEVDLAPARAAGTKSLALAVREVVDAMTVPDAGSRIRAEHLALLQRWLYRSAKKRVGELVQADSEGNISLRRLGSAAERVLSRNPEPPPPAPAPLPSGDPFTTGEY